MTINVAMTVNGKAVSGKVEARTLLVQFLREHLGLTGTHVGCDTSQCGACTVHIDGLPIKSCTILAQQCEGKNVQTIEGLGDDHPLQHEFMNEVGAQCGICTPGMIMAALSLGENPTLDDIKVALAGNLCRCTGYAAIYRAIMKANAR